MCRVVIALFALMGCGSPAYSGEEPLKVSACEVRNNPGAYNHKLIEVRGVVSRGFEDFTLDGKGCAAQNTIWLELGGTVGSNVMYCCGVTPSNKRPQPLKVEGFDTTLLENAEFEKFQKLTQPKRGYGRAEVTLIGRYFSGEKQTLPGGTFWMGYGHMGMATLLVVEEVKAVEPAAPDKSR